MNGILDKYKARRNNSKRRLLIENFPHNNFMLVCMYVANVLNKENKADVYFVDEENNPACDVYRELGYIGIDGKKLNNRFLKTLSQAHFYFDKFSGKFHKKNLLDVKIGRIFIGDLLIDTVIRYDTARMYDMEFNCDQFESYIKNAYYHYHKNLKLLKNYHFTEAIVSHSQYLFFGVLPRLGLKFNMKSHLYLKGGFFKMETESDVLNSRFHPTEAVWKELLKIDRETIMNYLFRRFNGTEKLFSIDLPFKADLRQPTRAEFIRELDLNPELPICTIYLHAFADANHYEQEMIYKSYFEWCIETINLAKTIDNVNWVVKDHPFCTLYDEKGVVPELMKQYNIKYVPEDINSKAVLEISDTIATVRGTVGLECVYFDIKPILAGYSYYSNYGFTTNCKTKDEYYKALSSVTFKTKVSDELKETAGRLLYWTADLIATKSDVADYSFHPEKNEDVIRFFNLFLDKVNDIGGIENDILYKNLSQYFAGDKKTLTGLGVL